MCAYHTVCNCLCAFLVNLENVVIWMCANLISCWLILWSMITEKDLTLVSINFMWWKLAEPPRKQNVGWEISVGSESDNNGNREVASCKPRIWNQTIWVPTPTLDTKDEKDGEQPTPKQASVWGETVQGADRLCLCCLAGAAVVRPDLYWLAVHTWRPVYYWKDGGNPHLFALNIYHLLAVCEVWKQEIVFISHFTEGSYWSYSSRDWRWSLCEHTCDPGHQFRLSEGHILFRPKHQSWKLCLFSKISRHSRRKVGT